jgi:hypothetical protein
MMKYFTFEKGFCHRRLSWWIISECHLHSFKHIRLRFSYSTSIEPSLDLSSHQHVKMHLSRHGSFLFYLMISKFSQIKRVKELILFCLLHSSILIMYSIKCDLNRTIIITIGLLTPSGWTKVGVQHGRTVYIAKHPLRYNTHNNNIQQFNKSKKREGSSTDM